MPYARQIGQRMLARRLALGMTQEQIADAVGVSATEIGRYEKGIDHISASRLHEIAILMGVSPGSFYPPVHDGAGAGTNIHGVVRADEFTALVKRPDTIRLLRAFVNVRGKNRRLQVIEFVEAFATRHATTSWTRYKQVGL